MDDFRRRIASFENFCDFPVAHEYTARYSPSPTSSAGARRLAKKKKASRRLSRRALAARLRRGE